MSSVPPEGVMSEGSVVGADSGGKASAAVQLAKKIANTDSAIHRKMAAVQPINISCRCEGGGVLAALPRACPVAGSLILLNISVFFTYFVLQNLH